MSKYHVPSRSLMSCGGHRPGPELKAGPLTSPPAGRPEVQTKHDNQLWGYKSICNIAVCNSRLLIDASGVGFEMKGSGPRVQDLEFRMKGLELRAEDSRHQGFD